MFIFTIMPERLTGDFEGASKNPVTRLSEIRGKIIKAEQRVKDLEALLTSLILEQNLGTIITGVDNTDINSVRNQLFQARAEEGELRTAEQFWQQIVDSNKTAHKDTFDFAKRA